MVIAKRMEPLVAGSSIIRKLFEEGKEMAKEVGAENVYDYSLGNPSVPAPDAVKSSIIKILDTEDPLFVHGYMSNSGYEEVRQAVADNLNERFQWQYKMEDIIMTVGAASGINDILNLSFIILNSLSVLCDFPRFLDFWMLELFYVPRSS